MTIDTVGIVGAGFMGSGIAEAIAVAGVRALVYEPERGQLERSRQRVDASLERAVRRGKLAPAVADAARARISYGTEFDALGPAELVIEAVVEDERVKVEVFRRLGAAFPDAILTSNTSSIPIANLAAATARPERVLGLHFFSPVPVMKVVEVVPALTTDVAVAARVEEFAAQIGKQVIHAPDRAGFLINAMLIPYLVSAVRLYEQGVATREDIDAGMRHGCGHPMGPLELCDFIGLDVVMGICTCLYDEYRRDEYAPPPLLRRMVACSVLGRKSGRGFYDYAPPLAEAA